MSYVSLYRRFRPNTFDKVVGQDHIVRTITNQIASGRIGHAYLFTGTRGTGKTTCAKIFARAVNCLNPQNGSPCGVCDVCKALQKGDSIDIIEVDAASNNGVDEIRDLRENVQYRPSYGKYKVYIIDEVHMLTSSAFNAFLKTLEEPPPHAIFILATTEVQKLPQTILSRCMRFDFRLVGVDVLVKLLEEIYTELNVSYDMDALKQIASQGEGSVRDTLSLADICLSYCGDHIGYEDTLDILLASNFDTLDVLGRAILDGNVKAALESAQNLLKAGRNTVGRDLANYFMDVLEVKNTPGISLDNISKNRKEKLIQAGINHSNYRISRVMDIMASMESTLRYSTQPRIILEANIVRACELTTELNLDGLINRVKELEIAVAKFEKGNFVPAAIEKTVEPPKQEEVKEQEAKVLPFEGKTDMEKLLEEMSITAENTTVFEENQESVDDKSYVASQTWSKLVVRLNDMNENLLYTASQNVDKFSINNNKFIAYTSDKVTLELLKKTRYNTIVQNLIKEELGNAYSFAIEETVTKEKSISPENKVLLTDLFGGKIKMD
ncbi:MAG TPA: DNA polymerase III subunit gamma/tau [Clostridia bacterium]|nr:DNA polymerase III subunit gamma/tau [Clostridia bacterium]